MLGAALGRGPAEARWRAAVEAGTDLTAALAQVGDATTASKQRIGWVTKGREAVDRFGADVVVGVVGNAPPPLQLAYFAAVAAVLMFVGWQLWDGLRDIGALAP